jgi:hypothetical protein
MEPFHAALDPGAPLLVLENLTDTASPIAKWLNKVVRDAANNAFCMTTATMNYIPSEQLDFDQLANEAELI